ncbi:MAG: hypothetical protein QM486_05685 [Flavobacteriaceae bacterium]
MNKQEQRVIYQAKDGQTQIDVQIQNDSVWLNHNQLVTLFNRDIKTIGKRLTMFLKKVN